MKKLSFILLLFISATCFSQTAKDTLVATATDPGATITSYQWVQTSGQTVSMTGATTPTVIITFTTAGTYSFKCTVTDSNGTTASDTNTTIVVGPLSVSITPKTITVQLK